MTAEEAAVMRDRAAYWADRLQEGTAIVFGPVTDPKGAWGKGVVRVADEAAVDLFEAGDPATQSMRGTTMRFLPCSARKFGRNLARMANCRVVAQFEFRATPLDSLLRSLREHLYRPSKHDKRIRVHQHGPHPVRIEYSSEIDAVGACAIFAELPLPPAPEDYREKKGSDLTTQISKNCPPW
jgi:hypothetical protein